MREEQRQKDDLLAKLRVRANHGIPLRALCCSWPNQMGNHACCVPQAQGFNTNGMNPGGFDPSQFDAAMNRGKRKGKSARRKASKGRKARRAKRRAKAAEPQEEEVDEHIEL